MTIWRGFITRLLCDHEYVKVWTIHGSTDAYGCNKTCWVCKHCGKHIYGKTLDRGEK